VKSRRVWDFYIPAQAGIFIYKLSSHALAKIEQYPNNDDDMSKVSYYTAEGLKKLRKELDQLRDVERPKASQAIAEARDKGDLSENAEYDAAKEAQGLLEMRISKLEETLANARLIDESQLDTSKVLVHSNVKIKNQSNGQEMSYKLVAQSEADLKSGKISVDSPIGKGLLGKKVGDTAEIKVPNGTMKFEILEITRD
jgi:transcription elongation factor GreA